MVVAFEAVDEDQEERVLHAENVARSDRAACARVVEVCHMSEVEGLVGLPWRETRHCSADEDPRTESAPGVTSTISLLLRHVLCVRFPPGQQTSHTCRTNSLINDDSLHRIHHDIKLQAACLPCPVIHPQVNQVISHHVSSAHVRHNFK